MKNIITHKCHKNATSWNAKHFRNCNIKIYFDVKVQSKRFMIKFILARKSMVSFLYLEKPKAT